MRPRPPRRPASFQFTESEGDPHNRISLSFRELDRPGSAEASHPRLWRGCRGVDRDHQYRFHGKRGRPDYVAESRSTTAFISHPTTACWGLLRRNWRKTRSFCRAARSQHMGGHDRLFGRRLENHNRSEMTTFIGRPCRLLASTTSAMASLSARGKQGISP